LRSIRLMPDRWHLGQSKSRESDGVDWRSPEDIDDPFDSFSVSCKLRPIGSRHAELGSEKISYTQSPTKVESKGTNHARATDDGEGDTAKGLATENLGTAP
jgi:hypothetical protein